ncbi:Twin-arginine translocation pathway signal [Profundibacterium mesophilum]|uniref:Twin arginine translocation signal domain containing protein n=1 Tax=Profundibacterium mesophilum KAUST100406-0324 TaxID=1037889 RepID=A0A921NRS6_9RHOB|nr:Twin-arginine translocation pathway signal [Profundibacterium mesophilum]KAF0675169.1 Twin arginine translocation signal domain containing protein [Profundibacterium mesophilum KAUST100406-0324]
MSETEDKRGLTRRALLSRTIAAAGSFIIGGGFLAARDAAWATELSALQPRTMATLVQMARDIYPHDQIGDAHYVTAVKSYDAADQAEGIEAGIAELDAAAQAMGHQSYLDIGWERDRVDVLRSIEESDFFQRVRGGLVTGLYNQKAVWPVFGYEGESYSHGGYIDQGFNDIAWI